VFDFGWILNMSCAPLRIYHGGNVIFVAHNCSFDFRFLQPFMHETAQPLCTLKCARQLFPDSPNHKQATLALYLGYQVDRSKAHSADGDLDVLMFIIKHLCEKKGVALPGLLEVQCEARRNTTFTFGKHKGKKPSEVDVGYCQWALKTLENLDADLRAALEARIKPQASL
jgi:DNA polymerase III epsilon subunit-like protein